MFEHRPVLPARGNFGLVEPFRKSGDLDEKFPHSKIALNYNVL
jgi:hypothetical protein